MIAIQHGQQIFNLSASFQLPEAGLDHQIAMPDVPAPETLPDMESQYRAALAKAAGKHAQDLQQKRPFESRLVRAPRISIAPKNRRRSSTCGSEPWISFPTMRLCIAACWPTSPTSICSIPRLSPTQLTFASGKLTVASIDHAMWFHRSVRVDDWLLYAIDSPSASGARGFTRGSVFARDGRLVASVCQEGLIRVNP